MITRAKAGITKPNDLLATNHIISSALDSIYLLPITLTSYKQATKVATWQAAMQSEFDVLQQTNTWTLVPHSSSYNLFCYKWVYD